MNDSLEMQLAEKYHAPAGVEQFGIEFIPKSLKTTGWWELAFIWFAFMLNPLQVLLGATAVTVGGLSFWGSVTAQAFGALIAMIAYMVMATLGLDFGLPGQVGTRMAFGIRGAKIIPSLFRVIADIYWFATQTMVGALGIQAVLAKLSGHTFSLVWIAVIFAIVQSLIAGAGYKTLTRTTKFATPINVILWIVMLVLLMSNPSPAFHASNVLSYHGAAHWGLVAFLSASNVVAAEWITMITDAADFCRYSTGRLKNWLGMLVAAVVGCGFSGFIGAYAGVAAHTDNVFQALSELTNNWFLLALMLLLIIIDNWMINTLNLYTAGLSLTNIFEKLGRFWSTVIAAALSVILSGLPQLATHANALVTLIGDFFSPIAGVLLADYLIVKGLKVDVVALYDRNGSYWYWGGFNPIAIVWTLIGFVLYQYVIPVALFQTLSTVLVVMIGYTLTVKLFTGSSVIANAANPPRLTPQELEEVLSVKNEMAMIN